MEYRHRRLPSFVYYEEKKHDLFQQLFEQPLSFTCAARLIAQLITVLAVRYN